MAEEPREIVNPRTGQRMRVVELRPELLRIDSFNPPSGPGDREPLHVHPLQESGAEVLAGALMFEVDGVMRRVAAGETITIPPNVRHRFWNEGPQDAHFIGFFRPALDIASFFESLVALAQQGEIDAKGMPKPMWLAVLIPEFGDEIRPVSPPWPVLCAFAAIVGPIARRRGYRARLTPR